MKLSQLRGQFISIGETIYDGELVSLYLNGIPTSWEHFIQGFCAQDELPSIDRLWTNYDQEEQRMLS